jgi:exopolysaccharide production protein ExoZ
VAWSLSYEFCFYLTMPIAVQLLRMRTWTRRYRVFSLCLTAATYAFLVGMGYAAHLRLLMFASGMLLYEATQVKYFISHLSASGEVIAIALFVLALLFVALVEIHPLRLNFLPGAPHWLPVYRTFLLGLAGFVFIFYSFSFDGILNRAFRTTALRWLGNMSYSYYLIHGLSLHVLAILISRSIPLGTESVLAFWLILPVAFLITLVASAVLFLSVERPISLNYMSSAARLPSPSPTMA